MIKAPEAAMIARQLNDTILRKRIVVVEVVHTPHKLAFFNGVSSSYENKISGILEAV